MPNSILVPLQVFGYGSVISMLIAMLIKVTMFLITKLSHEETDNSKQG